MRRGAFSEILDKDDAEERNKALKAAARIEKAANKKKADLRLAAMHQSHAGSSVMPVQGDGGKCGWRLSIYTFCSCPQ